MKQKSLILDDYLLEDKILVCFQDHNTKRFGFQAFPVLHVAGQDLTSLRNRQHRIANGGKHSEGSRRQVRDIELRELSQILRVRKAGPVSCFRFNGNILNIFFLVRRHSNGQHPNILSGQVDITA